MRFGLDWSDFSGNSGAEDTPLLFSLQSQQLALAALKSIQQPYHWYTPDDFDHVEWDEISEAIDNAIYQLMRVVMPDFTPVGMVSWFPVYPANRPDKWLTCDGATYSGVDYPDLFALLEDTFGTGGLNFTVPDLTDRFLFGAATDAEIGDTGGSETHTLTTAEIPAHNHVERTRGGAAGAIATTAGYLASVATPLTTSTSTTADTGGGGSHNNMPPYMRGLWLIKALP